MIPTKRRVAGNVNHNNKKGTKIVDVPNPVMVPAKAETNTSTIIEMSIK